jgi:hypothetical protein
LRKCEKLIAPRTLKRVFSAWVADLKWTPKLFSIYVPY